MSSTGEKIQKIGMELLGTGFSITITTPSNEIIFLPMPFLPNAVEKTAFIRATSIIKTGQMLFPQGYDFAVPVYDGEKIVAGISLTAPENFTITKAELLKKIAETVNIVQINGFEVGNEAFKQTELFQRLKLTGLLEQKRR